MIWLELKQSFVEDLSSIYDSRESEQIFYLIIEEEFGVSKIDYSLHKQELVNNSIEQSVKSILLELKANKPIQHILGFGYFMERKFKVSKDVLIPRQETEELVDLINKQHKNEKCNVLDIGTGSGCIPISLKCENPKFSVTSVDVSEKALEIAKYNAVVLKADIDLHQVDILNEENWNLFQDDSLDIIVSNPPYVREVEKLQMHKNVTNFDPARALYVEDDNPLVFYKAITKLASKKLRKGGTLYFEINELYGNEVAELLKKQKFSNIQIVQDLQAKDRFVYGTA